MPRGLGQPRYGSVAGRLRRWELGPGDAGYPELLESYGDRPPRLRGLGDPTALAGECLSVVGSRKATPYGLACARMAGRVAAECGITIVSGGAVGCDREAGMAALEAGGRGVVVPGCGADVLYPRGSDELFSQTLERGGCVVSLEHWGMQPTRYTFVRRNRLIAALSRSLVVCEAARPSGTFGTATAAAEMGRHVYAVPGSIFSPLSAGTNWLIETGASIVTDEQALEGLVALDYGRLRMASGRTAGERGRLMDALVASPMDVDGIASLLGLDVPSALALVAEHEASGSLCRLADGRFAPTKEFLLGQNGVR